jgi:hypothetical protein
MSKQLGQWMSVLAPPQHPTSHLRLSLWIVLISIPSIVFPIFPSTKDRMSSNSMSDCCVSGVRHEGESIGEYEDIKGGKQSTKSE